MPQDQLTPRRWWIAFSIRLLSGIVFAALTIFGATQYSIWLLLSGGVATAVTLWYVIVLLQNKPGASTQR